MENMSNLCKIRVKSGGSFYEKALFFLDNNAFVV